MTQGGILLPAERASREPIVRSAAKRARLAYRERNWFKDDGRTRANPLFSRRACAAVARFPAIVSRRASDARAADWPWEGSVGGAGGALDSWEEFVNAAVRARGFADGLHRGDGPSGVARVSVTIYVVQY